MRHLRRWGAAYVLLVLFLSSWAAQFITQLQVEKAEAASHGEPFEPGTFFYQFFASTFENWQSEFLQLLVQGLLLLGPAMYLLWAADQNADKQDIRRLEAKIDDLKDRQ